MRLCRQSAGTGLLLVCELRDQQLHPFVITLASEVSLDTVVLISLPPLVPAQCLGNSRSSEDHAWILKLEPLCCPFLEVGPWTQGLPL